MKQIERKMVVLSVPNPKQKDAAKNLLMRTIDMVRYEKNNQVTRGKDKLEKM